MIPLQKMSSLSTREEFGNFLNEFNLTGTGVELGVFRGDFASTLLKQWLGQRLVLVDPWKHLIDYYDSWNLSDAEMEQNYQITLKNLAQFRHRIHILRKKSEQAASIIPTNSCDFIYIDANHAYKAVKQDLHLWFPKLSSGGIMCGHDYFDAEADEDYEPIFSKSASKVSKKLLASYGVKTAVDEFVSTLGIELFVTDEPFPTWYFQKDG